MNRVELKVDGIDLRVGMIESKREPIKEPSSGGLGRTASTPNR